MDTLNHLGMDNNCDRQNDAWTDFREQLPHFATLRGQKLAEKKQINCLNVSKI